MNTAFAVRAFHTSSSHPFKRCSGVIIKSFYSWMPKMCDSSFHTSLPPSYPAFHLNFLPFLSVILSCFLSLPFISLSCLFGHCGVVYVSFQHCVTCCHVPVNALCVCVFVSLCVCVSLCVTGSCRKLGWLTLIATRCLTLRYSHTHTQTHGFQHRRQTETDSRAAWRQGEWHRLSKGKETKKGSDTWERQRASVEKSSTYVHSMFLVYIHSLCSVLQSTDFV